MQVSTTGTNVSINALLGADNQPYTLVHPQTNFDLLSLFSEEDVEAALPELEAARVAGTLLLFDAEGNPVTSAEEAASNNNHRHDADDIDGLASVATSGLFSDLTDIAFPATSSFTANNFYILRSTGSSTFEPFQLFEQTASRDTPLLHQSSTTFATYLVLNANIPVDGNYVLFMTHRFSINTTGSNFQSHIEFNGDFFLINHVELQDSSGTGINVPNTTGGTTNTGTDNFQTRTGMKKFTGLTAGVNTFTLEFNGQFADNEPTIYEADMLIKRLVE